MSERKTNPLFTDDQRKLTADDDKLGLYESSTTDSGFISSGNLMVSSSELIHEEDDIKSTEQPEISSNQDQKPEKMRYTTRFDSGINLGLTDTFANISLNDDIKVSLNELSNSRIAMTREEEENNSGGNANRRPPLVDINNRFNVHPWQTAFGQDEDGDTPLHLAIAHGFRDFGLELIRSAQIPQLLDTLNDNSTSPLHLAVLTQQIKLIRTLVVAGAKLNTRNSNGETPLHIAVRSNDLMCCEALINPIQPWEPEKLSLKDKLIQSAEQHDSQVESNLNKWNYEGQTCIHLAAMNGNEHIFALLMKRGADINAREGLMGYTALHYAIANGHESLLKFLLSDECKELKVGVLNYGGRSVLEVGSMIPAEYVQILRSKGVPTPETSEDEDDDESDNSEDEIMYENSNRYVVPNLVNASA